MTDAAPGTIYAEAILAAEAGAVSEPDGPQMMSWDSRARRVVTVYVPLAVFLIVLLFPFCWMTVTTFKPDVELLNFKDHNPFWISSPTLENIRKLLFDTEYPRWLLTTMGVAIGSTILSLFASVLAAYAIQRLRFRGSDYVGPCCTDRLVGASGKVG